MTDLSGRLLRVALGMMLVLATIYALLLVPGIRPSGYDTAIDVWLNLTVDASVIVVIVVRAMSGHRDRAAWLLIAAGLCAAFGASLGYFLHYRNLDPIPSPSLSDAGWLAFYALLYAALLLMLRSRVRHMLRSVWLDGLIAGLTVAAIADAFVPGARVPDGSEVSGYVVLYPLADLLLLAVGVASLAVLGRSGGRSWFLLVASFMAFAVTDVLYAEQVQAGTYSAGDPVDVGWLVARLLLAAAAVSSFSAGQEPSRDLLGASVLVIPAVCALAVLTLLVIGTVTDLRGPAIALASAAGFIMIVRTVFTFRELRMLTAAQHQALMGRLVDAQDEERARIAADVHDDSLQALAAVNVRLGALLKRVVVQAPEESAGIESLLATVQEAGLRLRHLLFELESPAVEADLASALRHAAEYIFSDTGVQWSVVERGHVEVPQNVRVSAYRIAREAMVNALKHADASSVTLTVEVRDGGVRVEVADDGRGVDPRRSGRSPRRHSGMVAMRDRAAAAGGWWSSVSRRDGSGTRVAFFLPLDGQGPQKLKDADVLSRR